MKPFHTNSWDSPNFNWLATGFQKNQRPHTQWPSCPASSVSPQLPPHARPAPAPRAAAPRQNGGAWVSWRCLDAANTGESLKTVIFKVFEFADSRGCNHLEENKDNKNWNWRTIYQFWDGHQSLVGFKASNICSHHTGGHMLRNKCKPASQPQSCRKFTVWHANQPENCSGFKTHKPNEKTSGSQTPSWIGPCIWPRAIAPWNQAMLDPLLTLLRTRPWALSTRISGSKLFLLRDKPTHFMVASHSARKACQPCSRAINKRFLIFRMECFGGKLLNFWSQLGVAEIRQTKETPRSGFNEGSQNPVI